MEIGMDYHQFFEIKRWVSEGLRHLMSVAEGDLRTRALGQNFFKNRDRTLITNKKRILMKITFDDEMNDERNQIKHKHDDDDDLVLSAQLNVKRRQQQKKA
ncbi:CLUMA_CG006124, isoform A [Clunio marinus]|uniref:CLUMA_CG006124, isoform A n=1 Tax=Clunio marinus TaxID=568069 RepID=A0A1J1HWV0_9DIPT|nr:CLUMA_CG006124, isoform A [Clunio marinus]